MSMPRYTCIESQHTISPESWRASARPSALFPEAVGPSTATTSGPSPSGSAKAPLELARGDAHQHRPAMGAVGPQVDRVELRKQRGHLFARQHITRAYDAVTR